MNRKAHTISMQAATAARVVVRATVMSLGGLSSGYRHATHPAITARPLSLDQGCQFEDRVLPGEDGA